MNNINIDDFLLKHNQHPNQISIDDITHQMLIDMKNGLNNEQSSLMMIPTYLTVKNETSLNETAIVIDAGGTNLRLAAVRFSNNKYEILKYEKIPMLGTQTKLSKNDFIQQLSELLIPYLSYSKKIGFCFSFPAEILPNKDGKVISFCKEVNIEKCEGMLLGKEIKENLKRNNQPSDIELVILNDTVATLLGGNEERQNFDGYIGLILGTGTNTAYLEKRENIKKISDFSNETMIINMESGMFDKVKQGDFDKITDKLSNNPTDHIFEKMISGAYLGNVIYNTIKQANEENIFSKNNHLSELSDISMVDIDKYMRNPFGDNILSNIFPDENDKEILYQFIDKALERSSKLVTANLAADIIQTDSGKMISKPVKIVIEGSTYHKCFSYKEKINHYMHLYINQQLQRYYYLDSGEDVNLIGSAKAALINL